ncbi:hypothetical protein [Psychrobacter phenylpyruvicus]|uniref:Uncharacterized protein n=1 Tax=Psychrobacter phenylpyruvicus TaxID=29432 RepID=A0A379LH44_9GAMM|nr:hypothetical protein [Psychrobacter phenylpyruvicus]SUD89910.1 Uncharacterised protein [Psychrobacter phenylpyruvicus]
MTELEKKIITSTKDGSFLDVIYDEYIQSLRNKSDLSTTLIRLHNSGAINLVKEFKALNNDENKPEFFLTRSILKDVLPLIDASVKELSDCIKDLTLKAGKDMASHTLLAPFVEFLTKDVIRVDELLKQELSEIDEDFDFISAALIAGFKIDNKTFFEKAIELLNHDNTIIIQRAIYTLGRFDFKNDSRLAETAIKEIMDNNTNLTDEKVLAVQIRTLIILVASFNQHESYLKKFLENKNNVDHPLFIHNIAQELDYNSKNLSESTQQLLFSFFKNLDSKKTGTIEHIDWYIYNKISTSDHTNLSHLFEYLIDNNNDSFNIRMLHHSIQELQDSKHKKLLSEIITRWFLRRQVKYCVSAFDLVNNSTDHQIELTFDINQIKQEDLVYLVNKSIGWFDLNPKTSLSLILSLIPRCTENKMRIIEEYVLKFVALNFPTQTKEFLEEKLTSNDSNVEAFCENIINKLENYFEQINTHQNIKELRPSNRHRVYYRNYEQKLFEDAMSKSNKNSLVDLLFPKKVVTLYGNKFIHKHEDVNGNVIRQVTPFSKLSHSIEYPNLASLTPHTLDYYLRVLKLEGLNQ